MYRLLIIVLALIAPTGLLAETLKVGIEKLDYPPYYSTDNSGNVEGAAVAVLEKFSAEKGYKLELKPLPVARLLPTFLSKEVEYKFPDNANWGKNKKQGHSIIYSDPIFQFTDGTVVKVENKGKPLSKLGIVRGFTAWDYQDQIKRGEVTVIEGSSLESLIKMLNAGRIDGLYFNVDVAHHVIHKTLGTTDTTVFDESLPHTTSDYHLSSNGNQTVIDEFNAFMKSEQAFIRELKNKYGLN